MKNKILAVLLTAATLLMSSMSVAASEYGPDEGTADCMITCVVTSSYTVSIPAAISMVYSTEDGTASGTYQIGVKGDLLPNQKVHVAPSQLTKDLGKGTDGDYVYGTLSGQSTGKKLSVTVNQKKCKWIPAGSTPMLSLEAPECIEVTGEEFVYVEGTVTSGVPEAADTYTGTLVFEFGIEEYLRK